MRSCPQIAPFIESFVPTKIGSKIKGEIYIVTTVLAQSTAADRHAGISTPEKLQPLYGLSQNR